MSIFQRDTGHISKTVRDTTKVRPAYVQNTSL